MYGSKMRAHGLKQCVVRKCKNNSRAVPEKHFLTVPTNKDVRTKWFKALNMEDKAINATQYFVCEDHFDLKEDMMNWMYFKTIGTKLQIKKHVVPHRNLGLGDVDPEPVPTSQLSGSERKWKYSNLNRFRAQIAVRKKNTRKKNRKSRISQVQHSVQPVVPKPICIVPAPEVPTLPQIHSQQQPVVLDFRPGSSEKPILPKCTDSNPLGLIMLTGVPNPISYDVCITPLSNPTGLANAIVSWHSSSGKEISSPMVFINPSAASNTIPNMPVPCNIVSTSQTEPSAQNATQETSHTQHIEQIHIKEEPLNTNHNDWEMYQEVKKEVITSDSDQTDSANVNNRISKESVVNIKQELCDSDNQTNVATENVPVFENVFIKEEPVDDDFYS